MNVSLAYGRGFHEVTLPDGVTTVINPTHQTPLPDERAALIEALNAPISAPPLASGITPETTFCIVFTDITRATPNERLIPWLLDYLEKSGATRENITLLNALGTHRPNTEEELKKMLTPEVVANYRVLNHEPESVEACETFGVTNTGVPVMINRHLVKANVRIITGFIEPHFFAGFSGGPKGIMPGVAHSDTVMSNHGAHNIGDPRSAFGITEGNPIWEEMRDIALRIGTSFLINVTLGENKAITGIVAGDLVEAHKVGIELVRSSAMQKQEAPYDIVITTASGYPLDQNLYQGVKGMSAAARIVKEGGTIILAAECCEGLPRNSHFEKLLHQARTPEELAAMISTPGFREIDQWSAQIQTIIQRKAEVLLFSSLDEETVRKAHLAPCSDIGTAVAERLSKLPAGARVAVLPQGPLTIPYLA